MRPLPKFAPPVTNKAHPPALDWKDGLTTEAGYPCLPQQKLSNPLGPFPTTGPLSPLSPLTPLPMQRKISTPRVPSLAAVQEVVQEEAMQEGASEGKGGEHAVELVPNPPAERRISLSDGGAYVGASYVGGRKAAKSPPRLTPPAWISKGDSELSMGETESVVFDSGGRQSGAASLGASERRAGAGSRCGGVDEIEEVGEMSGGGNAPPPPTALEPAVAREAREARLLTPRDNRQAPEKRQVPEDPGRVRSVGGTIVRLTSGRGSTGRGHRSAPPRARAVFPMRCFWRRLIYKPCCWRGLMYTTCC